MKDFFFLILGLVIVVGSFFLFFKQNISEQNETKIIKINDVSITVEIARTPEMQRLGLSGRSGLPEGAGMFFIFDTPDIYAFWMKDMYFPIDIVWINETGVIIGIERNVSPETFPQNFSPNQAVKYVLEVPAGFTEKYRIDIGAVVQ